MNTDRESGESRKVTDRRVLYCSTPDFFEMKKNRESYALADFIDKCSKERSEYFDTRITIEISYEYK